MQFGDSSPAVAGRFKLIGAAGALVLTGALASAPVAPAGTGGAQWMPKPRVKKVSCVAACASRKRPSTYSMLKISGSALSSATHVVFQGVPGRADNARVAIDDASRRAVKVRVPPKAQTGPIRVWAGRRVRSAPTNPIPIMPPAPPEPSAELSPAEGPSDPGAPAIETGTSTGKFFLGRRGGIVFGYRLTDDAPVNVEISLVRAADNAVVHSWSPPPVQPGVEQELSWDGLVNGAVQPEGRYSFRLVARDSSGASATSAQASDMTRDSFDLYHHVFPVRGRHDYGGAGSRFGSGRSGHSHQGHDVFARCGKKLVAARSGVVKFKQYHSAAGHYIVIDGDNTDVDYAYMHLTAASPFKEGDRVSTREQIGTVGDSGNAQGCHLHFEMWGAPGWYDGGRPFDPLPHLQAWDAYS